MRINDKILTMITGLILFAGVGGLVHKGEEWFGPSIASTEVAKADISYSIQTDGTSAPYLKPNAFAPAITELSPPDQADFSDFRLVRSDQSVFSSDLQQVTSPLEINIMPFDCSLRLSAKSLRGARVELGIFAPCQKSKIVTIAHADMRFTEMLNEKGMITITIPVLSDPANIIVSFADGTSKSISTPVKDLTSLQRTGVAWSGRVDLQLQAQEVAYNAYQNTEITVLNARSYKQSYLQGGGYMTMLGNPAIEGGKFVQIYSLTNPNDIFVDFKVVLKNPDNRCGVNIAIKTLRYIPALGTQITNKNVSVKNCSGENGTIVLKNLLRNLIVAQRN